MAKVVERMPNKGKALSSNSSTSRKKQTKKLEKEFSLQMRPQQLTARKKLSPRGTQLTST
jgi:hypothetical protein